MEINNNLDIGLLPGTTLQKIGEKLQKVSLPITSLDSLNKEIRELHIFKEFAISKKS